MTINAAELMHKVNFDVEALPEDADIDGFAGDEEDAAFVRDQLDSGNEWGWCTAKVTAKLGDIVGDAYLGCCSYKSKADFMAGPYYEDMKGEALDDVRSYLERTLASIPDSILIQVLRSHGIEID